MKNRLQNLSFKKQLFLDFAIVIIIVSLLILQGLYVILWNSYRGQAITALNDKARQIAINIDNKLVYYLSLSRMLILNDQLIAALENDEWDRAQAVLDQETRKLASLNSGKVHSIKIYTNDDHPVGEGWESFSTVREHLSDGSELIWTGSYLNDRNEKVFAMFQKIYQKNLNREYYLEMCIYETELLAFFNVDSSGNKIYILNQGMLMSSTDRDEFRSVLSQQRKTGDNQLPDTMLTSRMGEIDVTAELNTGWTVNIKAKSSYISRNFLKGYLGIIPAILIAMGCAFLFVSIFSKKLSRRMESLHQKIDYISQWDLKQDLQIGGNDEFKVLADALDQTRLRILNLIDQIKQTNELKRVAEMTALRSQIKSHFLFNSLSSIKWLSRQNNPAKLSQAVDKLSFILRYSLSLDEDHVLLSTEVEHLRAYVFLEKLRYNDSIIVHIDIDEDLLTCKTVKLILQPLVENSIYHGRREDSSPLSITIYSFEDDDYYYLVVEDDGNGMSETQIREIIGSDSVRNEDAGYGLKNVINRLRICTGDHDVLSIESKPQVYTKTTIRQPKS